MRAVNKKGSREGERKGERGRGGSERGRERMRVKEGVKEREEHSVKSFRNIKFMYEICYCAPNNVCAEMP